MVRFGDVVRNVDVAERKPLENGLERYVGLDHLDPESLHIKRWGLIEEGTSFTRKFVEGQVLFGKRRAYQRKAAVAEFDGICSGDILVFEPKGDELIPELLPFIVQSDGFFEHALGTSAGSLSPRTKWKDLASFKFVLPPKDEQHRIADILWAADLNTRKAGDLINSLQSFKESLMHDLFASDEEKTKENHVQTLTLGEVLVYASDGPFGSNLKTEHYASEGARVIRLQNVGEGEFLNEDKAFISYKYYQQLRKYALKSKDIIVAGLGDETHAVGRVCQIPDDLGSAINKADCFCLRANPNIVEPEYLLHYLNSPYARRQVKRLTQGTTRFRINVTNLKTVSVPVPDRKFQLKVCSALQGVVDSSQKAKANLKTKSEMAKELRNTLLSS